MKKLLLTLMVLLGWSGVGQAAITAVTATANTGGSVANGNFTLTSPTGTAAGDVLIIAIGERSVSEKVSSIAGHTTPSETFTLIRSGLQATNFSTSIWYRIVLAGDDTTWDVTNTSNCEAGIMAYRGVDNVNPVSKPAIDAQGTTGTGTTTTATFNAVTTLINNAWYVGVLAANVSAGPDLSSLSSGSPTPTTRTDTGNGGTNTPKELVAMIDVNIATAGSSGTFVYNLANANWSTDSFALRPAASTHPDTIRGNSTVRNSTIN